ncbi:TetR/AcrR family transcriptional regulator [Streptomyces sp. NPDC057302]|uniref:TetR/AcrR family transcriptional regulator n=1 Tax=Streptomyces sp. NPDC057302 TaxID=3346094 RepID=UPI00362F381F
MNDRQIRDRILDAARECLAEFGLSKRLHASIAERAGLSRPTVYKYVGDQSAVIAALLDREIADFLAEAEVVLTARGSLRERFTEIVVFVVGYGRAHPLLSGGLRHNPDLVLPWFTTRAEPLIEQAHAFFSPHIKRAIAEGEFPDVDPRPVVEWTYRIIISLLLTPSTLSIEDPDALRKFVSQLLDIGLGSSDIRLPPPPDGQPQGRGE